MPPNDPAAAIHDHMSTPQERQEQRKPKFDGTINLGHIIQAIILIAGFWMWLTTARVQNALLEARVTALENNNREVRDSMREMTAALSKVAVTQERMTTSIEFLAKQAERK